MSNPDNRCKLINAISALFILWLLLWLVLLIALPRSYYTPLFFVMGFAPVAGWFLIRPRRIVWFISTLFGINALDEQP